MERLPVSLIRRKAGRAACNGCGSGYLNEIGEISPVFRQISPMATVKVCNAAFCIE
ncbi:hypothetical protein [Paenibacillus whitsoniae]|uniref:hypothetical protein n=1 Tax=Paenibacillus whitsoniae TaxID=2496558 RepID=UPI0013DF79B1|nr:hypothetical protein [Paenibacillus whitsoniae]